MNRIKLLIAIALLVSHGGANYTAAEGPTTPELSVRVQAFYYPWYGTPDADGAWKHWDQAGHTPPNDLSSNFYPLLGAYSSSDPAVIDQHMRWARRAGVGALVVSWWGTGSFEDRIIESIFDAAAEHGLRVSIHIEPYDGWTPDTTVQDVRALMARFGEHPAMARSVSHDMKPMFYVYQALAHTAGAWRDSLTMLREDGPQVLLIGQTTDLGFIEQAGFDGGYPYDGFAPYRDADLAGQWYGRIASEFEQADKIFVGTVCPGYLDDAAVPNGVEETVASATRDRGLATTYDSLWQQAIDARVPFVAVTSFNEWHEGSQIEPAGRVPELAVDGRYRSYKQGPMFYLDRTRYWSGVYLRQIAGQPSAENRVAPSVPQSRE
jgi:hypothetical protein